MAEFDWEERIMVSFFLKRPSMLFAFFWGGILMIGSLPFFGYEEFSDKLITYIVIAIILFASFSMLGSFLADKITFKNRIFKVVPDLYYGEVYFLMMLASILLICLDHYLIVGNNWWNPSGINNYRYEVTEGGKASNLKGGAIFNYFFYTAMPLVIACGASMSKKIKVGLLLCTLIFIYLSASRSSFFLISLLTFWFYFFYHGTISSAKTIVMVLILVAAFLILGSITGKSNVNGLWRYFLSPIHGLDVILQSSGGLGDFDLYLFRPFHSILYSFDIINKPDSLLLPYVYTPYPVNVYTFFSPYILDFGLFGSYIALSILGVLTGYFSQKGYRSTSPRSKLIASLFMTMLILGVFYDYYLSSGFPLYIFVLSIFIFPERAFSRRR